MDLDQDMVLTRDQVRLVDQLAVSEFHIPSIVLMENAGRNAAEWIAANCASASGAVILCGPGNNGGDGFVIARHLSNFGWSVRVALTGDPARLCGDARINYEIADAMDIDITVIENEADVVDFAGKIAPDELVVDALLGTGFAGAVREPMAALVRRVNEAIKAGVVAVDVPSGLDCDNGSVENVAIRADATVTFVAKKPGLINPLAASHVGRVVVRDIGAPRCLIDRVTQISEDIH